jgi:hypothetical protein
MQNTIVSLKVYHATIIMTFEMPIQLSPSAVWSIEDSEQPDLKLFSHNFVLEEALSRRFAISHILD